MLTKINIFFAKKCQDIKSLTHIQCLHSFYSIRCTNNYSIHLLSFPPPPIAFYLCLKNSIYARYTNIYIRPYYPRHPRLRSLHHQDIRSLQGGAQHRTNHYQRQDEVHHVGRRQPDAVQN